jgi:hypothetical protein
MSPTITSVIQTLDRAEVRRAIDELRRQIEAYEALLEAVARFETDKNGDLAINDGGHATLSRKREAVLEIMRERPGRWTTSEIRDALAARGINPQAGTPVKNVLWNLAKAGHVRAIGNGVYELSVLAERAGAITQQEAIAA